MLLKLFVGELGEGCVLMDNVVSDQQQPTKERR